VIERVAKREGEKLPRRERVYREARPLPDLTGKVVILVDDADGILGLRLRFGQAAQERAVLGGQSKLPQRLDQSRSTMVWCQRLSEEAGGQVSRGGCVPTATGSERVSGSDNPSRHCGSSGCDDASGPAPWVRPGLGRPRRRWTT
jgi:hypothetical protein